MQETPYCNGLAGHCKIRKRRCVIEPVKTPLLLCENPSRLQFVETFLAVCAYQRQQTGRKDVKVTHRQLQEIALRRFGSEFVRWEDKQIDRLKNNYITRLSSPSGVRTADRFELLREVFRGERARGQTKGTPSVYHPTGIEAFLHPVMNSGEPSK
jgi:hypothetical protein